MSNTSASTSKSETFDLDNYLELYYEYQRLQKKYNTSPTDGFAIIIGAIAGMILFITAIVSLYVSSTTADTLRAITPVIIPMILMAFISCGMSWMKQRKLDKYQPERIVHQLNTMIEEHLIYRYGIQKMHMINVVEPIQWHNLMVNTLELSMMPAKVRVLDADHRTKVFSVRFTDGKPTFITNGEIDPQTIPH